jgi:hypothetical protein
MSKESITTGINIDMSKNNLLDLKSNQFLLLESRQLCIYIKSLLLITL